jgi:putative aldouronate transport system permease protein
VVVGLVFAVLSPGSGIINRFIVALGFTQIYFFNEPAYFPFIIAGMEVWQNTGWGTIVYLAAITGIDPALYEAAVIDGAGRLKQVLHITIPAIMPTVITLLILRIGSLFSVGYQRILLLYNPTIYETADIIQTFVYRRGITGQEYSFSTAVDLFNSVVNLVMLLTFNKIMSKVSDTSLW